jgi:drug/metabolite transporter (DMT)-like permease
MSLPGKQPAFAKSGLIFTVSAWGSLVPITAILAKQYDPYFISLARYALAVPLLFFLFYVMEVRDNRGGSQSASFARLMVIGLPMAGFTMFYTLGIVYSNPISAAVILTTGPILAAILGKILSNIPLVKGFFVAITLSVIGASLVVTFRPGSELGTFSFQGGEPLLILALSCWSFYSFKCIEWLPGYSQIKLTAYTSGTASIWLLLFYVLLLPFGISGLPNSLPDFTTTAQFLWIGWGAAGIAIIFWHRGARALSVPVASLYINLVPFVAVLVSFLFLDIIPTELQIVGGLCVIAGVLQIQLRQFFNRRTRDES